MEKVTKGTLKFRNGHEEVEQMPKVVECVNLKITRLSKVRGYKCLFEINKNNYSGGQIQTGVQIVFRSRDKGNGYLLEAEGEQLHQ